YLEEDRLADLRNAGGRRTALADVAPFWAVLTERPTKNEAVDGRTASHRKRWPFGVDRRYPPRMAPDRSAWGRPRLRLDECVARIGEVIAADRSGRLRRHHLDRCDPRRGGTRHAPRFRVLSARRGDRRSQVPAGRRTAMARRARFGDREWPPAPAGIFGGGRPAAGRSAPRSAGPPPHPPPPSVA